jgi:hypothetical protein
VRILLPASFSSCPDSARLELTLNLLDHCRPFKIALLDVVTKQQAEEQARAEHEAELQKEETKDWAAWGEQSGIRGQDKVQGQSLYLANSSTGYQSI